MTNSALISIGLSPNLQSDDVALARKTIRTPSAWFDGQSTALLTDELRNFLQLPDHSLTLVSSARSALTEILTAYQVPHGEVLVQGFTCVAVTNPIHWSGMRPVFVDIDTQTLNMNISDLERKITPQTRAIIVQHTFGLPQDQLDHIQQIAQEHDVLLISDCAHSLGASYHGYSLAAYGDYALLSFGRDKIISSVFGGAVVAHNASPKTDDVIAKLKTLVPQSRRWVLKQLLHPIITDAILKTYGKAKVGEMLHELANATGLLSKATSFEEKQSGAEPEWLTKAYPDALAQLALHQLGKINSFNEHRTKIAEFYRAHGVYSSQPFNKEGADRVWLRYPLLVDNPEKMHAFFSSRNIVLGDWYDQVVAPRQVDLSRTGYTPGMTPQAESVARHIINLPTHPRMSLHDAEKVVAVYNDFTRSQ